MTEPIRVVIADDHEVVRVGLRSSLEAVAEVTVVDEAVNGSELLAVVNRRRPDVVLTDIRMPDLDGIAATRSLLAHHPGLGVLILTNYTDDVRELRNALAAGARGFLSKAARRDDIVRAIIAVAGGGAVYDRSVAPLVGDILAQTQRESLAHAFPELTAREREILELLAHDRGNQEIARRLGLSGKTIRNHVSAILAKLRVPDRAAAVAKVRATGFCPDP